MASLTVSRLRFENWRNFRSVDVQVPRRVFLVGPNAAGKSNFLDIMRFLHDIVSIGGGLQEAVRRRGGVSMLRCLAARQSSDIAIEVTIGSEDDRAEWQYELAFSHDPNSKDRRPLVKSERVSHRGQIILSRPTSEDEKDRELLTQTHLEQVNANRQFREIAEFFASIRYLHIVPQLVREPDRVSTNKGIRYDPYGSDFLDRMAQTSTKKRAAWLKRINEALKVAVPQLSELELYPDTRGKWHLRAKYQHWRPHGAWQEENAFSDGTLRLLGLLWALLDGNGPLLLEEPELSLNAAVVRQIPQMFNRVQRRSKRQIFVSTHSPDLLADEGIGMNEVLILVPGAEGTSVRSAGDLSTVRDLVEGGIGLGEAVRPHAAPAHPEQLRVFGDYS